MKKLIALLACLIVAGVLRAEGPDVVALDSTKASTWVTTNGWITATSSVVKGPCYGYVEQVELISGYAAAQTCAVLIVTATNSAVEDYQVIYSNLAVTVSDIVYPRIPYHTTAGGELGIATNEYGRMFLVGEYVKMYIWKATAASNCTLKAKVKLCP